MNIKKYQMSLKQYRALYSVQCLTYTLCVRVSSDLGKDKRHSDRRYRVE